MHALALVTAAHPYWSGIGIWIGCVLISLATWSMCKERFDDADDVPAAPGLLSERRKVS